MNEARTAASTDVRHCGAVVLMEDRFEDPRRPGTVIGSPSTSGLVRLGADREGTIAIDHGQLRIGWLAHGGWGRASLAYGPFEDPDGLLLVVRALNGLTTSQSDPRSEGRRAALRRIAATFPHASLSQPRLRDNLLIGWFTEPVSNRPPEPIAAVVHRAGEDATGELWFQVGARRERLAKDLQNLPATYAIALSKGVAALHAWSYTGAHVFAEPGDPEPLAEIPLEFPLPASVYGAIHQPVLGEVRYRVDTRIASVHVLRAPAKTTPVVRTLSQHRCWEPQFGPVLASDGFDGAAGDLHGSPSDAGDRRWMRVMGAGVIERTGGGLARVRASVAAPNPGRTVYCMPWDDPHGAEVAATVIPPGRCRGEGHQGRSGVVLWQDPDNHLVVNHFLDDGSVGVSISAFLRVRGEETMFEWDAVWSNVAQRVQWGRPFDVSVACDGRQFLCRIGKEPVLYRQLTDYRSDARPLRINGVGVVANWEWGDDTGTGFRRFAARRIGS